jgi:hypothetical protein
MFDYQTHTSHVSLSRPELFLKIELYLCQMCGGKVNASPGTLLLASAFFSHMLFDFRINFLFFFLLQKI